jgi:hypothetical protein
MPFAMHAFECTLAAILELDSRAGDKVLDGARNEDLSLEGGTRKPMKICCGGKGGVDAARRWG